MSPLKIRFLYPFLAITLFILPGCSGFGSAIEEANTASNIQKMKNMSAGGTGCLPEDIDVQVVDAHWNNTGVWKARCKEKTYICSFTGIFDLGITSNCAPEVR